MPETGAGRKTKSVFLTRNHRIILAGSSWGLARSRWSMEGFDPRPFSEGVIDTGQGASH